MVHVPAKEILHASLTIGYFNASLLFSDISMQLLASLAHDISLNSWMVNSKHFKILVLFLVRRTNKSVLLTNMLPVPRVKILVPTYNSLMPRDFKTK